MDDQPLDPIGDALRQRQAQTAAPVVEDEREALEPGRLDEGLEPGQVAVDRVVEVVRLRRSAKPWQVGSDPADPLQ